MRKVLRKDADCVYRRLNLWARSFEHVCLGRGEFVWGDRAHWDGV